MQTREQMDGGEITTDQKPEIGHLNMDDVCQEIGCTALEMARQLLGKDNTVSRQQMVAEHLNAPELGVRVEGNQFISKRNRRALVMKFRLPPPNSR